MIIRLLESIDSEAEENDYTVVNEIEVPQVDPLRVAPVREKVGRSLSFSDLAKIVPEIRPFETFEPNEPDSYYAQDTRAWRDADQTPELIDIPHYIGVRTVLQSILKHYGMLEDIVVQIG